jgi:hypothetical protein
MRKVWTIIVVALSVLLFFLVHEGVQLALQIAVAFWPYVLGALVLWGLISFIESKLQQNKTE